MTEQEGKQDGADEDQSQTDESDAEQDFGDGSKLELTYSERSIKPEGITRKGQSRGK